MKILFALLLIAFVSPLAAHSDIIQRGWSVPPLTPIIQVFDHTDDPFRPEGPLRTIETFEKGEIKSWLQNNGIEFPQGSSVSYFKDKNRGQHTLVVRNTPTMLEMVDGVLKQSYPVHTSRTLIDRFLRESEGQDADQLPAIIAKYPARVLGPVKNLGDEIVRLDGELEGELPDEVRNILKQRRARLVAMLPESLKANRLYLETLAQIMAK